MVKFKKTLSGDSKYSITLEVWEKSTDIGTNSSEVGYKLTATKSSGSGYYTSNKTNTVKVTINGDELVNKKIAYDFRNTSEIKLASGTKPIQHDPDGTKTIACSGYFKDAENSLGSATASGSLTLTQLHKAPEPTITNVLEREYHLTEWGVNDNVFVSNVSIKMFTTNSITDDATISKYKLSNGNYQIESTTSSLRMDFQENPLTIVDNQVPIVVQATDSKGGVGTSTLYYSFIPYTIPTLIISELKTPRDGQLTGKVKLIAKGNYYNGKVGTLPISPQITYYVKDREDNSYVVQPTTLTPTYENGNWSIEADIGTERGTSETPPSNWFDPSKSYQVFVYCNDQITSAITEISTQEYSSIILNGDAIMTKYKDKVDFKKLTINKKIILAPYLIYENDTGNNGTITLDDSFANYEYIEVFYKTNDDDYKSTKVYKPNGKYVLLDASAISGNYTYVKTVHYSLSGNTMTLRSNMSGQARIGNNVATTWNDNSNRIYITRILGYK